ncbi:MipA/OmpV family protein [Luteibacter sp. UNCMF366Tsu5.1]|uniref:MipA/OmpV family protein n=1 Tax=Luteibacter sp. UNCMF366Tsu5.1 TaxID=1502758 RepID=UPI000908B5DF|nr:MipA/OmpV family protein [Luteibacter sp. UNCMF366Tsu5.1]SFW62501.1 outer membrane protein [Luteibacter sp. UNCMF366Tsu5.1]
MAKMTFPCLALAGALLIPSVPMAAPSTSQFSLGVGFAWSPSPYRSYDNKAWPLPVANYEGERFFIRGVGVGMRLWRDEGNELSLVASPIGNRFRHDDTDDTRLRRLSDRDISGQLGVQWRSRGTWGVVQLAAQKEVTGHGGGHVFDANYGYPLPFGGGLVLIPMVGATYTSDALNDYYYGITDKEALKSGLPAYRAGSGTAPYAGVTANAKLGTRWNLLATLRLSRLPDAVKDSPMVTGSSTRSYLVALSYRF